MQFLVALLAFFLFPLASFGNKIILYTDNDSYGSPNQEKKWYIAYGEPAFANFYDLKVPDQFFIITPKGEKQKLTLLRRELFEPWLNQPRIAFETQILPKEKGDYLICIEGDNLLGQRSLVRSMVKTVFHVQREEKWDNLCGFELEIKPFTRPYGLRIKSLFWGQVLFEGEPLTNGTIIVERLRTKLNPKALPLDSTQNINYPILQKTTRLDNNGYFFVNFEEPGWWLISVVTDRGVKVYGNQKLPYLLTAELWIYVFDFPKSKKLSSPPSHLKGKLKR